MNIRIVLVFLCSVGLFGCVSERKPCTALAEVKASSAEAWANAHSLEMEAYTGLTEKYSELRELVKRTSRAEELSALMGESTEAEICTVLAEEATERAEESTELAKIWGILAEEVTEQVREYTALANRHTRGEDISIEWAKVYQSSAEGGEYRNRYVDHYQNIEEYRHALEIHREIRKRVHVSVYEDDFLLKTDIRRLEVATEWAERESRLAQTYTARAEELKTSEAIAQIRAWAFTEKMEAYIALSEAYTALAEEATELSEISILLVAEAYTTLSKAYTEQAEESTELATLAEAYTALAEEAVALAEGWD